MTGAQPDGPLCFTSEMHIKAEYLTAFLELVTATADRARSQPGCRYLHCHQLAGDPTVILMHESWHSRAIFDAQVGTQTWFTDYLVATENMHSSERAVRQWNPLPDSS